MATTFVARVVGLLGMGGLAAGLGLASLSTAHATPLPPFTFNPAAAGLNGSQFTADNMILSDYATVTITPNGTGGASFTDVGVLPIFDFSYLAGGSNGGGLGSTYGLYYQFSGAGTQNTPTFVSGTTGTFSSLTYQLFGYNIGATPVTYNPSDTTPNGVVNPVLLGTGTLITGGVGSTLLGNVAVPNANTLLAFTASEPGFFVSPSPFYNADFAAFTNNPSQVTQTSTGFVISQGGGSANFVNSPVPEPMSLTLLGTGLVAVGALRSRRRAV